MIRNLAAREGIDLATVRATGPGGQITRDDVLRAKADAVSARQAAPPGKSLVAKNVPLGKAPAAGPAVELSSNQRVVARRVLQSHREIVPINLVARVNMSGAIALRERSQANNHARADLGMALHKLSFDAIFIHAISRIISHFQQFRLRMIGEEVSAIPQIHIGLAVSVGPELYTPTVTYADERSLEEIDSQIRLLAAKARDGKLTLAEMSGACFTISNLGMLPVVSFDAAIPPGQAAALAIGAIEQVIAVRGDRIVSEPFAAITLSVDHRLINGRQGAEFLASLKQFVEKL
jgi:pyruvate dehydrogenase E2 component (dihydrolipoamide acetyltransferase)